MALDARVHMERDQVHAVKVAANAAVHDARMETAEVLDYHEVS